MVKKESPKDLEVTPGQVFGRWLRRLQAAQGWSHPEAAERINAVAGGGWTLNRSVWQGYGRGDTLGIPAFFILALYDLGICFWPDGEPISVEDLIRILAGTLLPPDLHQEPTHPEGLALVKEIVGDRQPLQVASDLNLAPAALTAILAGDRPSEATLAKLVAAYDTQADQARLWTAYGYGVGEIPYTGRSVQDPGETSVPGDTVAAVGENQGNVLAPGKIAVMVKRKSEEAAKIVQNAIGDRLDWAAEKMNLPTEIIEKLLEGEYPPTHKTLYGLGRIFTEQEWDTYLDAFEDGSD
ncbi:MAG: hypothetical protein AAFX78_10130 [Cyanobacteria bacterium J06638_20]